MWRTFRLGLGRGRLQRRRASSRGIETEESKTAPWKAQGCGTQFDFYVELHLGVQGALALPERAFLGLHLLDTLSSRFGQHAGNRARLSAAPEYSYYGSNFAQDDF
jgi:hypothetical protein